MCCGKVWPDSITDVNFLQIKGCCQGNSIVFAHIVALAAAPAQLAAVPVQEAAAPGQIQGQIQGQILPEGIAAVIDAAVASGNVTAVETVARFAREAYPQAAHAIDQRIALALSKAGPLTRGVDVQPPAGSSPKKHHKPPIGEMAHAPSKGTGEGELGALTSSGNTPGVGFVGGIKMLVEGRNWRVGSSARVDYQETANVVTRDQYRLTSEPNYNFSQHGYVFGLGQYEKDRFQGFISRYSVSGGLGYSLIAHDDAKVKIKAGPAWRRTLATNGDRETIVAGLASVDVNVKLAPSLQYVQDASAYVDARGSTLYTLAALDSRLIGKLKARLSYMVQHETAPEPGRMATDATSRLTLAYQF